MEKLKIDASLRFKPMNNRLWIEIMFATNGPSLRNCIKNAWRTGGLKFFFHNLSCELRRGRYPDCHGYQGTLWDRCLFSLGVLLIDPWGWYFYWQAKHNERFRAGKAYSHDKQWLSHPYPWIRRRARKMIEKMEQST